MNRHTLDTQADVRAAFWAYVRDVAPRYNTRHNRQAGQNSLPCDLRMLWCDWIDAASKDGTITEAMANKVTL
jgi:hypothetical protein